MCLADGALAARLEIEKALTKCRCGEKPIIVPAGPKKEDKVIAMCASCQNSTVLSTLPEVSAKWNAIANGYGSTLNHGF